MSGVIFKPNKNEKYNFNINFNYYVFQYNGKKEGLQF